MTLTPFSKDALARVFWTLVQVVAGIVAVRLAGINTWWAVAIAGGLAVVKMFAANTAMTNPLGFLSLAALERLGWTAAQAALGLVVIDNIHAPIAWTPVLATILAALKTVAAKHIGSPDTAATLPELWDPFAPNPLLPAPDGSGILVPQPVPVPPNPSPASNPIPGSMVGYDPTAVPPAPDMPAASSGEDDAPPAEAPEGDAAPAPAAPAAPAPAEGDQPAAS
jgi:hypothetical protein